MLFRQPHQMPQYPIVQQARFAYGLNYKKGGPKPTEAGWEL